MRLECIFVYYYDEWFYGDEEKYQSKKCRNERKDKEGNEYAFLIH